MQFNIILILTILIILFVSLYAYYNGKYSDIIIVKSTLDNKNYLVRRVNSNCIYTSEQAANILSQLQKNCISFIKNLNSKYNDKSNSIDNDLNRSRDRNSGRGIAVEDMDNKLFIERLTKNYRLNSLSESSAFQSGTSYSLNKGEKIVLCLRQKEDNSFIDFNTLMFVLLHELTHLGTVENKTHSPIFDRNFQFVLREAIDQNLYEYRNYKVDPVLYCGKVISETPLN